MAFAPVYGACTLGAPVGQLSRCFRTFRGVAKKPKNASKSADPCRINRHKLAIALANKLARIAWSVLRRGRAFDTHQVAASAI
jgi:hypothetical protein